MDSIKRCFKCGAWKDRSEFYAHAQMADGLLGKCKDCTKRDATARRNERIEEVRRYDRMRANLPHRVEARAIYAQSERGKETMAKGRRKYTERNPAKRDAHLKVQSAIRTGQLKRQPCEVCGQEKVEAHHSDYSKPLEVMWLCSRHHAELHSRVREAQRNSFD